MKFITFVVGGVTMATSISSVIEIVKNIKIKKATLLPGTEGITNFRGNVLPIIDLRKKLNIKEDNADPRILVCNPNKMFFGLVVDAVKEVKDIQKCEIEALPPSIENGKYYDGIIKDDNTIILIVDVEKIINENGSKITRT